MPALDWAQCAGDQRHYCAIAIVPVVAGRLAWLELAEWLP